MQEVRTGLYALAISIVVSTLVFSFALTSAAGQVSASLAGRTVTAPAQVQVQATATPAAAPAQAPQPTVVPSGGVDLSAGPLFGSKDAKVALVEYSDFQCPFCGRFYSDAEPQIMQNYVNTGKVALYYKEFPLDSIHPNARPAANAFECVKAIGGLAAGQKMHDLLFTSQTDLNDANYAKWAAAAGGVDAAKFAECYSKRTYDSKIDGEEAEGVRNGINGTPGFVIVKDGKIVDSVSGALPYASFKAILDKYV